ncbi:sigma-70 family RNA polymerase sigma factor [Xanthocytophaga agilis]|uniref:Sigma-70 family RNA polymerase sigma factor n=1 Tax=Xanthocytophaga agilis TaxID=3048010 RepID=A0AAE3R9X3_9BACT|nr:sigma-70 family RNA polymerase sigma factor [Xanthocytophaga agilis]MDJ1506621.1 sigma-70 family RNA polymerase sigma factor [Xanthocytophaga agilis]
MSKKAQEKIPGWVAFKEGSTEAFSALYFQYFKSLYEYGMRLCQDEDLVKDCIHDLFIKLWSNKSNLGNVSNIKSYLLVSLRGLIYDTFNSQRRRPATELEEDYHFEMVFSAESEWIDKENFTQQTQGILDALNQLTPRQKEVIYLRYFEELSYEEIAEVMQLSVKATYKLVGRGMEALREILNVSKKTLLILLVSTFMEVRQWLVVH